MRILLITNNLIYGDGQGRVNLEIARHCLAQGHAVTLIAIRVDAELTAAGANWVRVRPGVKRAGVFHHWRFATIANRRVRELRNQMDLVVGNGYTLTEPHDINLSHFVHGAWRRDRARLQERGPRAWYRAFYSRCNEYLERFSYNAADAILACSNRVRSELGGIGLAQEKIRVIHHGVDLEEFHPGVEDRLALGLPPDVHLGLFVGDVRGYRKNLDTVLKALVHAPSIHLAVVGAFDRSPFPAMSQALGIADRIHFLGFRRDVPRIMRACTFLALPTRYEPFGLVILEAMASGLPVVTSRVAGAAELMNEECGMILDDPECVQSLAQAMKNLSRPEVSLAAGTAARKVANSHSWSHMAARYLSVFEEVRQPKSMRTADQ